MRKIVAIGVVVVGALVLGACGETVNIGDNGVSQGLTVQATGTADIVPDAVRVSLGVSVLADTNEKALAEASNVAAVVRDTLTGSGIDPADIATQSLTVNPEYTYTEAEGQQLIGYRASQFFDVLIRDAANAGSVIDEVVSRGGPNVTVNSTTPVVDDASDAAVAAREDAVAKARGKAEAYAKLLDVELGDIVYLTEMSAPVNVMAGARADMAVESAATVIDLGTQEVSVTIEVRWEID